MLAYYRPLNYKEITKLVNLIKEHRPVCLVDTSGEILFHYSKKSYDDWDIYVTCGCGTKFRLSE